GSRHAVCTGLDDPRWTGDAGGHVLRPSRRPRSRGPGGVAVSTNLDLVRSIYTLGGADAGRPTTRYGRATYCPRNSRAVVGVEAGVELGRAADLLATGRDRHDEPGVVEELWRARERRSNSARRSE